MRALEPLEPLELTYLLTYLRYELAATRDLAEEGFSLYRAKGKIWACEIGETEARESFPQGQRDTLEICNGGGPYLASCST